MLSAEWKFPHSTKITSFSAAVRVCPLDSRSVRLMDATDESNLQLVRFSQVTVSRFQTKVLSDRHVSKERKKKESKKETQTDR